MLLRRKNATGRTDVERTGANAATSHEHRREESTGHGSTSPDLPKQPYRPSSPGPSDDPAHTWFALWLRDLPTPGARLIALYSSVPVYGTRCYTAHRHATLWHGSAPVPLQRRLGAP